MMSSKPTYEELENRIAALERRVEQYETAELKYPPEMLSVLMEAFRYIPLCNTFEEAAKEIFEQCRRLTGARSGYVALLSENGEENEVLFLDAGGMQCDVDPNLPMPIRGLRDIAYKTKEVAYDNAFSESPWMKYMPEGHVRLDNVLFSPLNIKDKTVGIIGVANKPEGFTDEDVYISKILGDLAAVALTYANAQDSLRKSEEHYRTLFANINDSVFIHKILPNGEPGKFLQVNKTASTISGYSPEELKFLSPRDLDDPDKSFQYIPKVMEHLKNSGNAKFEAIQITKDGRPIDMEVNAVVTNIGGEDLVLSVCRDITERKNYQDHLEKFKNIVSSTSDGIAFLDENYRYIIVNDAYERFSGIDREKFLGMTVSEYLGNDIFEQHIKPNFDKCLKGKVINYQEWFEYPTLGKKYVDVTYYPYKTNEGRITGVIANTRDITERKEAEDGYNRIKRELNDIAENIPGMVFQYVLRSDGSISIPYVSSNIIKYTGISPNDIYADPGLFLKPIFKEDKEYVNEALDLSAKNLSEFSIVHRLVNLQGKLIWFQVKAKPTRLENGDIIWNGVSIEISDRIQAEIDLRNSEKLFRTIFNQAAVGIAQVTPDGKFINVNSKFSEITGYSKDELRNMSFDKITYQEDLNTERKLVDQVMKGEIDFFKIEKRYLHKGGHHIWIELFSNVVRDENNNIEYAVASVIDISERKKIENDLKSLVHDQSVILDNVPAYIYFKDTENNILRISQSVSNITGLPKEEIEGRHSSEIYPEMAECYWADDLDVIASKKQKTGIVEPLPVGNGETRWLMTDKIPVFGEDDEVIGVVVMASDITDRVVAENELKESENRFQTLIESGPIAILMLRDGEYIYGNPAAARMLGYENSEDIIGVSAIQTVAPEFRETIKQRMKRIDEGKANEPIELKFVKRNGGVIWTLSTSLTVTIENKPTAVIMGQDITELKKAAQELSNAQTIQIALAEHLPAGIMLVDASTRIIESVNAHAASLFGANIGEIVGHKCHKFICPASENQCPICDLSQKIDNAEREIILKDGNRLPVLKSVVSITIDGKEKLLEYFIDISARKKAELDLKESEEKYRKLVETAPYGIQLTDREGKILFSNKAHHRIQGYDGGELIGKYIWDLMADDNLQFNAKQYYQKLISEQPVPEVYFNRDLTRDGREIDVQVNWDYIKNFKGEVEGIISIISDITKQKALEASIQQAQKMESIGNLAGGIAHDFNNILFPIMGMSELLLEDLPRDSIEYENAKEIFNAGKRGSDLVKQILAFSRQSEQKKIPIRIQQILKEVMKLSRSTIPADINLTQNIQSDCSLVQADPTQVHQIAMNLITNAYHAVESKSGEITVRLNEVEIGFGQLPENDLLPGRYAKLSVSDTGTGIEPAIIHKIFDPYFTTKEQGKGTGLGLAVVFGIVKDHHGDIKVHSELGKGTTFDVYLPIMTKPESSSSVEGKENYPKGHEHILLVDDEEPIARLEKQMLERLGYKVTMRVNSMEALEAFRTKPDLYDLVISDMTMPNMTGDQLARELIGMRSNIPIIICTGFSERMDQEMAASKGVQGFLMKPVVKFKMANTVRKVLDEAKGTTQE